MGLLPKRASWYGACSSVLLGELDKNVNECLGPLAPATQRPLTLDGPDERSGPSRQIEHESPRICLTSSNQTQ
jgi:hypothetical protein